MPCQRLFAVRHDVGGADERRHVEIVAAGMHDGHVESCVVLGMHFAGIGKSGLFLHGKRVEFGAQHDRGPGAVFEDGDDSGATDSFGDFIAQAAQASGEFGCGLGLVRRELGRLMKINVESVGRGIDGVHFFGSRCGLRIAGTS